MTGLVEGDGLAEKMPTHAAVIGCEDINMAAA